MVPSLVCRSQLVQPLTERASWEVNAQNFLAMMKFKSITPVAQKMISESSSEMLFYSKSVYFDDKPCLQHFKLYLILITPALVKFITPSRLTLETESPLIPLSCPPHAR